MKPSDAFLNQFYPFSVRWKPYWSLPMVFGIDWKRFLLTNYTFEAFGWCLELIYSVFCWTKRPLKLSDGVWNRFNAIIVERQHLWRLRMVFEIDLKQFLLNEVTFEAFGCSFESIQPVFCWMKTQLEPSDGIWNRLKAFSFNRL